MLAAVNARILFKLSGGKDLKPGSLKKRGAGFTLLEFL
jgi:hypothetical protein